MGTRYSLAFWVSLILLISVGDSSRRKGSDVQQHTLGNDNDYHTLHHRSGYHQRGSCNHIYQSCNLTNALETTYYAKFNYTGPIAEGLTCYTVYKCDGNVMSKSPTCDPFVYYLLYMEANELSIRAEYNSNNCNASAQRDPIWTPDSDIFNYKELVFRRNGTVTIRQRQRSKPFAGLTIDQLIDTDYATLNKKYPRNQLKKWSENWYLYNGTVYYNNGGEFTERELCLKDNRSWACDSNEHLNPAIRDSIPWHMKYFDALSGYLRIQFFLENRNINRTGYHGMDGDGWNVTDTIIDGEMAGKTNWQDEAAKRLLFFDKLWVEGCRCQNHLKPGEDMVTECEHWNLMKRNFEILFKPAGLNYCPNMDHLDIPADAFKEVS